MSNRYLRCIHLFIFWLWWVFVAARRLSLVPVSGGYSLIGVHSLLVVVASLTVDTQALGTQASAAVARGRWSVGSVVAAHWLGCSASCGLFPDQRLNRCPLYCKMDS